MTTIFLVGARAAGKTTIGKALAQFLGLPFIDTDQYLLETGGRTVSEIVAAEGWPGFRARESANLLEVADKFSDGGVIATGGGIVLAKGNRELMRERGTVLYLSAPAEVLAQRLSKDPLAYQRPSLTGKGLIEEMAQVLDERQPLYHEAAHHVLDAVHTPEELCKMIKSLLSAASGAK